MVLMIEVNKMAKNKKKVEMTEEEQREKNGKKIVVLLLLLSIIVFTAGASYAFFQYIERGNTVNVIETGDMVFRYDESKSSDNGIQLLDALPMSDLDGKSLQAPHQYFDFQVYTNIVNSPVEYQVVAAVQEGTNLPYENVKVYLTERDGNTETPVQGMIKDGSVIKFNTLEETNYPGQTGKVIYRETLQRKTSYSKTFRLRLWVSDDVDPDADDYLNKKFTIKVNVYAQSL